VVNGEKGSNRVNRGGSWNNDASNVRAANRNNNTPGNRNNNLGLRPASSGRHPSSWRSGQKIGVCRTMFGDSGSVPFVLTIHH
jgi:hypothetical protein